jgi:hypothetical protein
MQAHGNERETEGVLNIDYIIYNHLLSPLRGSFQILVKEQVSLARKRNAQISLDAQTEYTHSKTIITPAPWLRSAMLQEINQHYFTQNQVKLPFPLLFTPPPSST